MRKIKVLSLFDGISCGRVALERAGIEVETYYASEIEPKAIKVSNKNYPDNIQLGDITKWKNWDIDWNDIDLVIGGSPCQGFSFCGKQLNFEDERSKLFFVYKNILSHIKNKNPNIKFLLENVKMKKEYQDIISSYLGVKPIEIDSRIITPMRRKRLYWFNWDIDEIQQNTSKLKDILDDEVDDRYFLKQYQFEKITYMDSGELCIRNQPNKRMVINEYDGVSLNRTWQQYMPVIRQESNCIRAANPDDVGVAVPTTDGIRFRRFTLREIERMQTLPIGYTVIEGISERQSKGLIGNGWTVDVIAHIFKGLKL